MTNLGNLDELLVRPRRVMPLLILKNIFDRIKSIKIIAVYLRFRFFDFGLMMLYVRVLKKQAFLHMTAIVFKVLSLRLDAIRRWFDQIAIVNYDWLVTHIVVILLNLLGI